MKQRLVLLVGIILSLNTLTIPVYAKTDTIPYKIIKHERVPKIKASYDIIVNLVKNEKGQERLPIEAELKQISLNIKAKEKNIQRLFVTFYLPGMKIDAGAFATAHYNPTLKVVILDFMLMGTEYERFLK